jgi:hypothetical protein
MAIKEAPKSAFVWVLNGQVSAITFPGEPVSHNLGVCAGEVPIDQCPGVGDFYPPKDAPKTKAKAKSADAA